MSYPDNRLRKVFKRVWCPKENRNIGFKDCIIRECCLDYDMKLEDWIKCGVTRKKRGVK